MKNISEHLLKSVKANFHAVWSERCCCTGCKLCAMAYTTRSRNHCLKSCKFMPETSLTSMKSQVTGHHVWITSVDKTVNGLNQAKTKCSAVKVKV